jgi:hypothetical protein
LAAVTLYFLMLAALHADAAISRLPPVEETWGETWEEALEPLEFSPSNVAAEPIELPATRFSFAWLAGGRENGFGSTAFDLQHTWLLGYDDLPPLNITPGGALHLWSGPQAIDLPPRVYELYVDLAWRPIEREHWGLSVGVTPGLYGDFERIDGETFQVTGWLLANYRFAPRWNLLGGVAYVRQLRSTMLPIGGMIWTPHDDLRLELLVPKPKFTWCVHRQSEKSVWCYVAGQLGGGSWAVADAPDENVLVGYTDLRLLLGTEGFHTNGLEWNLEAGYVFARDISVDRYSLYSPSDTFVLQASVAY